MTDIWTTATAGAIAGLGVAMPMGAIGVLLVQEAMRDRRGAMAGAAAVACVDMAYAALATALGPLVAAALSGVEAWVRLVSALILAVIAVHGLLASRGVRRPGADRGRAAHTVADPGPRGSAAPSEAADPHPPQPRRAGGTPPSTTGAGRYAAVPGVNEAGAKTRPSARDAVGPARRRGVRVDGVQGHPGRVGTPGRAFVRFAALTLVNPTTALYFAALTTAQGATLRGGAAGAVFVGGVLIASMAWQQLLVGASGLAGARIPDRARAWTFRLGYGLVAVYAVNVALPLP
ncbi:hypothetical protein ABZ208_18795 [Streptomyces sp. NPDC006208]|uniref:hypothetical protein n=1 Tax=Streptomyces sp. NPDC006208 TaxID=3156734 RepID=UPI0033B64B7E